MHSRRFAAAFLTCLTAFAITAYIVPLRFVAAEGSSADKQCPAEVKDKQEYQPGKPWNKYFTEKRGDKTVTVLNLFGKTCKDVTNEEVTTGHCIREDRCKATKTAEGKDPATCKQTGDCDPGSTSGTDQEAPDNGPITEPTTPKPDNSDGVLPLPEESKPDPFKTGAEPFNAQQPNNSFTETLQKAENSESWFAKTIETYFSNQDPMGPNTSGIGNNWGGAQSLTPSGGASDGAFGSQTGGSLYDQATNNYTNGNFNNDTTGFGADGAQPTAPEPEKSWSQIAGEYLGEAGDWAKAKYDAAYETVAGLFGGDEPAVASETPAPEKDLTDPFYDGPEPLPELKPMTADEIRAVEDQQLQDRLAQADTETKSYEQSLKDADSKVPVPEPVQTDPQAEFERANREESAAAQPKSPLPNAAPEGRTGESILQDMNELKNNILDPLYEEKLQPSNERLKDADTKYREAVQRADNFRDDNMIGLAKDGVTPQFKTQAEVDAYNKLQSEAETARQVVQAESLTNEVLRDEYKKYADEYKGLQEQYDALPQETKAFEAINRQQTEAQVKAAEIADEIDKQRAIRDDPNAAFTDRANAAVKLAALEKQMSAQESIVKAMENRISCVYNCTFGNALADAYKPVDGPLSPEQQAQRTGLLESAQEWANAQRALNNPPDFSTVTNPETGIFEPNPRAAEDQARWESERQADIDRANKRGEEFAGLRERSAETQNFIDAKTGNQNPLLTAYQTYIGGLKSIAGLNLETPLTYAASQFTSDQQLIDGYGSLGSQMAAPLAPMVGLGAGAGEQFLGAIGEPLADTQLSNLYKADDALAIQRTLDIGATALNAVGFAPESMLAKAGSLFSAERIGADIASDLGSAVAAESRLSRMENQLGELNASYERALSRVGTDAAPTSGELAAMRNEISAVESNVARLRGTESGTSPIAAADVSPAPVVPQEVRALTYGDAAPTAVSTAETSAAARAFVTGNDTTELGGAISRAADAGAIERAGIAEVNGQRYLYEAPVGEGAVLTPIRDLSVSDLAPMSAKELNAIADAKGVSPVVSEPTVLRNAVTDVTPAERTAISRLENAGKDLAEWRAVPDGRPSPVSRVLAAEQALDEIGVSQSLDGTLYRSNSGEILGRLETAETPGRLLGRADAELPRYTKAGDEWFESSNLSRPITNSDIISALEAKLPTNSVSAAQVAADSQWAKGVASFEAKQAEVARAARAAEERAAREAAEKAAEKNPPAVSRTPTKAPTETVPRLDNSPEVIADLRRLEAAADRQALSENGRILSGPTSQSLQDGMNAFKAAGGVPEDIKFARAYLDKDAVYRVTPEGNLSRITNSEIAESVRSAQNPLVRTAEAESIARVAQNIASEKEAAEALKAQIAAAKVYDGEIMVAQDVREAGRAIAGDVDALARQGARDARQFTWSPEAQLPQTLAEATGGKAFLSEVEAALENPFHAPTTNFSRGSGNVSSDGLAAAREPYRAPQNTFTEAQAAVRERLGGSTPPETIAQRASLTETRVAPSPKTVVHDLAEAANDIPLVEVKNVPGTQLGDALTVPEATAIHSFNSALANYTKLAESGGDISRAATQVSNAFAELAEVGITQRATDGALARDTGEVVAVRVSPPMAAQATYAVVVPVDPQVREFATGSTDETFSFEAPDLRILSSDFGVEPPINTDEAITLKKANDILENTRSRDALENLFKKSDLSVRPQDGFIVRNNGEIVARPEGTGSLPGALPERYVPAGPMPALPLKLQQNQKFTMPNGTVIERFKATDYNGKTVADVSVTIDGTKAVVDKIQANTLGRTDWDAFRNVLGPSQIRSLLRQFRETHPEIVSIGGIRMSGARFAGEWDPANTGEVMELILPTIPAEPVPISIPSRSTIPTALALSVALTVASPIPMDAISNAFNGAANVFSTAAQAAPKPTARDIERHGNAVADIGQVKKGVASWYGTGSNGGTNPSDLTASGAWHTNSDYTVAMLGLGPKYAWGTRLLVKNVQEFLKDGSPNPAFGKEVEVVVTSTGGQPNRSLDLSPAARDALGIGADGTALVEFTVVSVPDIMDSIYKKGRTDLTGGSPVPKGTFNTKIAQLKQDPKLAIAQAGALSNPTVVGANAQNPVNSALDAAAKVFGDILKGSKTANDKAVDLASNLQRVNPNISAIDIAARLDIAGLKNSDTYQSMRERAAHEIIGKQGSDGAVTDAQLKDADVKIAQRANAIKNPPPAPKLSVADAARASGQPQIKGIDKLVYLAPLSDPAKIKGRRYIVIHQTEGPTAASLAKKQAANPNKVGTTLWVEPDGTVYWSAPETANPSHVRANRNDNQFVPNQETYNKINNANSIGIEFAGNFPDPKKPLTQVQMEVGKKLITFLQERYNIPAQNVFAHGWIDYKHEGYVEGEQLAKAARELAYVPRGNALASADVPSPTNAAAPADLTDPWAFSTLGDVPAIPAPEAARVSGDTAPEFTKAASTRSLAMPAEAPAIVPKDVEAVIALNVQSAPESPMWKLPTPTVTVTITTPLEAIPVPTVTTGPALAEVTVPSAEQIAAIPIPDQAAPNFNDVKQPVEPLAANPVPNVIVGPELNEPIPTAVIQAAKLSPVKSTDQLLVYAQPAILRGFLFQSFGTYSYLPPAVRQKLYDAENDDDFIVFTKQELDSIGWSKMDKNAYQVLKATLAPEGQPYTPPVPNGNIEAGPQVFADGIENQSVLVLVKETDTTPLVGETGTPAPGEKPLDNPGVVAFDPVPEKVSVEAPPTIEQVAGEAPIQAVSPVVQTPAVATKDELAKQLSDTRARVDATTRARDAAKNTFDANNAKLKEISEYKAEIESAQSNLNGTTRGLTLLKSLTALPDASQLEVLKASGNAANRLAASVRVLENTQLAGEIQRFANLVIAMRAKENQTAGNKNAAIALGNALTKKTNTLIAESKKELAGMGNVDQLKAANKALATEFATANKSLASGAAEATALEKAIAAAPARETRGLPNDATPPIAVATAEPVPTQTTPQPEQFETPPTPVARPSNTDVPSVTVTTGANPEDQSRISKAISRTVEAIKNLDTKLLTDTAIKSYKKIAQAIGLGPKEVAGIPNVTTGAFDAQQIKGSDLSYVCSTGSQCTEKQSDAVLVTTEPGRTYARIVAGDTPVVAAQGEAAIAQSDATFLARAAGGFVTTRSGKTVSQDITYSDGKLIGSKTVDPTKNQGLVISNSKGGAIIVDKRDIALSDLRKLDADIGANTPTDHVDVVTDLAKFDQIMHDNKLSAFSNLLLIKGGQIQNVQSSIAEPRRLLIEMPDGRLAILNSTKDQTMLGITQIAKALGAKNAVNLDTGAYNEGRVAVQSGDAPYLGNSVKSQALTNIYLGIRNEPVAVAPTETTPSAVPETPLDNPSPTGAAPLPSTPTPGPAPIDSFGVNARRPDIELESPVPSNDNTESTPLPNIPLPINRSLSIVAPVQRVSPAFEPVFTQNLSVEPALRAWPTVTRTSPDLILEGEILPPARVGSSMSQVAGEGPILDLEANRVIGESRHAYVAADAYGQPKAVIDVLVADTKALVSMQSADGVTIPDSGSIKDLLTQLNAAYPNIDSFAVTPTVTPDQKALTVVKPSVNVLPALENILVTGPTLYVNSAGRVWPSLAGASADADLHNIVTAMRAETSLEDGIADIVASIDRADVQPQVRPQTSVPSVQAPRATPEEVLGEAIKGFASDRAQAPSPRPRAASPKPDVSTPPPLPGRSFGQIAGDIWSDAKLAARISRGVVLPASTVPRNIAVNTINMMGAYMLTGPYTVITWPMANVGWRYVFNKDYRADVNSVWGRVATAVKNARLERETARANQELLNPNSAPSVSVPSVQAPEIAIEDAIRTIVEGIRSSERTPEAGTDVAEIRAPNSRPQGVTPETVIDAGIAQIVQAIEKARAVQPKAPEIVVLEKDESDAILQRVQIRGDAFLGTPLTPTILNSEHLGPRFQVTVGEVPISLSAPYRVESNRVAVVAYVDTGNQISAHTYTLSNSQGVWRYLPDYITGQGTVDWYGKGYGEASAALPAELQQVLSKISEDPSLYLQTSIDPYIVFAGTAHEFGRNNATYYSETDPVPQKLDGNFYGDETKLPPEQVVLSRAQSPDFSKLQATWTQRSSVYGEVTVEVFPSVDGTMRYLMNTDYLGRVWVGAIEDSSPIQSTGLRKSWILGGDVSTPAYEYKTGSTDQTGGYAFEGLRKGVYVDMFQNYLSKVPFIQEYIASKAARTNAPVIDAASAGQSAAESLTQPDSQEGRGPNTLEQTIGEFAADRPEVEKWGPFSNLKEWFRNLGRGGSGNSGGNGGGGNGGSGAVAPSDSESSSGSVKDGIISVLRLIPGLSNLIANAPDTEEEDEPSVDVRLDSQASADKPARADTKAPTSAPSPETKKDTATPKPDTIAPKPDATAKPPTPKPDTAAPKPNAVTPKPNTTTPPPSPVPNNPTPTSKSAPTGGTNAGGSMSGLMSFLSGLMKGLGIGQSQPVQSAPKQPLSNGGITVSMYAQPNPAARGEEVLVSWTSMNASTCSAFNASSTKVATGAPGAMFKVAVSGPTKFTVYCSNQLGQYASATVQVLMQ